MELFTTQREIDKLDFTATNRAANLCILRKVADVMGKTDLLYNKNRGAEKGILDISENTVSKICTLSYEPRRWKVDAVAENLKMDKRAFTGEFLIRIKGDTFREFQDLYIQDLEEEFKKCKKNSKQRTHIEEMMKVKPTEELLWYYILRSEKKEEDHDFMLALKKLLWTDLSLQIVDETFRDAQLWLFWNYLRKI
jgi:hypothetical protein